MTDKYDKILAAKGLKPTSNRILVLRAIDDASRPVSLADIDLAVSTMYKATIFRVLNTFAEHDVVHTIDDGSGSVKYELCHSNDCCTVDDQHVHFYCHRCRRTICLQDVRVPMASLPDGYHVHSVNYVVKGICPDCRR